MGKRTRKHGVAARDTYHRRGKLILTADGGMTRCLGPIEPEHTFRSPDRVMVRLCPRCRAMVEQMTRDHSPTGIRPKKEHSQ